MQTDDRLRDWSDSAPHWHKHADTIRAMFGTVTDALIEEAGISQGQWVLDVAGGAGEPSLTVAKVVGTTGLVTFTDPIPRMVVAAESEAKRLGITNVVFHQSTAESLPFEDDQFDAAVCRLGVMFFADPAVGIREMLRVTKRRGRVSLVVWGKSEANPFSYLVTKVLSRYVQAIPSTVATHDAFCFAEPGKLAGLLEQVGAVSIRERILQFGIAAPLSPEQFWLMRSETSGTLRDKLATLSEAQRQTLAQEVQEAVLPYFPNNQMSFPGEMLIVTGEKPD